MYGLRFDNRQHIRPRGSSPSDKFVRFQLSVQSDGMTFRSDMEKHLREFAFGEGHQLHCPTQRGKRAGVTVRGMWQLKLKGAAFAGRGPAIAARLHAPHRGEILDVDEPTKESHDGS